MRDYISDIAFADTVKKILKQKGSSGSYANMEPRGGWQDVVNHQLRDFLAEQD